MKRQFTSAAIQSALLGFAAFFIIPHVLIFGFFEKIGLSPAQFNPFDGTPGARATEVFVWVICVLTVVVVGVLDRPYSAQNAPCNRVDPVVVFLLIGLASNAMTWLGSHSVAGTWIYGPAFIYCATKFYVSRYSVLRIIYGVIWLAAVQSVYAIAFYVLRIEQVFTPHFGLRTAGTLVSPNALYPVCMMSAIVALVISLNESDAFGRISFATLCLVNMMSLIFTYSRAGWIGIAVGLVYLVSIRTKIGMNKTIVAVCCVGAMILLAGSLIVRTHGQFIGTATDRSALGRLRVWQVAAQMLVRSPIPGYGIGSYYDVQESHMSNALSVYNPRNAEAKSLYLNVGVEEGVFGLIALLWLLSLGIRAAPCQVATNNHAYITHSVRAAVICLAAAGLFDTPVWQRERMASTYVCMLILPALSCAACKGQAL